MKNWRRKTSPHQICDRLVSLNICRLRTTIYVSFFFLPRSFFFSLYLLLTFGKADEILPDLGDIFENPQKIPGSFDVPHSESTVSTEDVKKPEMVIYTPVPSTRSSSFIIPASSSDEYLNVIDYDGYDSPPPHDERIANIRNERRYRLLLTHDYHPSRRSSI